MRILLRDGLKNKNLSILNTYDPHMGYRPEQIETYWLAIVRYIDSIPKTYMRTRRTYYNEKYLTLHME